MGQNPWINAIPVERWESQNLYRVQAVRGELNNSHAACLGGFAWLLFSDSPFPVSNPAVQPSILLHSPGVKQKT